MDAQQDSLAAAPSRVVVIDSEVPEGGWITVDLGRRTPGRIGWAGPAAGWAGTAEPSSWRAEARHHSGASRSEGPALHPHAPHGFQALAGACHGAGRRPDSVGEPRNDGRESRPKEPLTIARLEAWAERLRGAERPLRTDDASMAAKAPVVAEGTGADEALIAQEAPVVPNPPVRSIRPEDLVPIGRKPPEPPTAPEPPVAERPLVRPRLEVVAGSSGLWGE